MNKPPLAERLLQTLAVSRKYFIVEFTVFLIFEKDLLFCPDFTVSSKKKKGPVCSFLIQ